MPLVIVRPGIGLLHEHPLFGAVPVAAPGVIRPGEAEGKVRLLGSDHLLERALQEAFSGEPVMPVAERLDAGAAGQLGLRRPGFRDAQVIEAQVRRKVGLIMSGKQRTRLGHVGPFGEALAPPGVILRGRMVLGQVEGDEAGLIHWERERAGLRWRMPGPG